MDEATRRQLAESARRWDARAKYGELTPAVWTTITDACAEQAVVDFVIAHRRVQPTDLAALPGRLPAGFGVVYGTWLLDAEVANGGFHQYFWNSGTAQVSTVRGALEQIGTAGHQKVFERAVDLWSDEKKPSVEGFEPLEALQVFSESARASPLAALDGRWYELGDLSNARLRFIRGNPQRLTARLPWLARVRRKVGW